MPLLLLTVLSCNSSKNQLRLGSFAAAIQKPLGSSETFSFQLLPPFGKSLRGSRVSTSIFHGELGAGNVGIKASVITSVTSLWSSKAVNTCGWIKIMIAWCSLITFLHVAFISIRVLISVCFCY